MYKQIPLFSISLPFIFNYISPKGNSTHFIFSISILHGMEMCFFPPQLFLDTNILKINRGILEKLNDVHYTICNSRGKLE